MYTIARPWPYSKRLNCIRMNLISLPSLWIKLERIRKIRAVSPSRVD